MTLSTQFITIISMIIAGVYLGASYYTFKRVERLWTSSIIWKYGLELLFWLLQASVLYLLLFIVNEGVLRFYLLLAVFCGYAMFKALFEQSFGRVLDKLIHILLWIYRLMYRTIKLLLVKPIVFVVSLLVVVVMKIIRLLWLLLRIPLWPIKTLLSLIIRILPKRLQKFLHPFWRFYSKMKKED
ncbi:spore cortex biosynthesis protein YabQ [Gracilibacillus sp. S3-1-1]|uniref:Spore cortex biosynthesis protein YabQ n=1 Tax=Gracilibacillus pellucidus TaxID=3095368 RepID=A0ACC6M9N7_9BACI|nr:spore cortex biosynthesis protein YabQ [Gracilibacillus sp. S3-1-1]MDX8047546.1 spore cortex biosynthesis protein YabQ [Gracilibacillus sp. S3-1-1]